MSNEGNQPYTPTRLEWLTLQLNAEFSVATTIGPNPGFMLRFRSNIEGNAIIINVTRLPNVDETTLEMHLQVIEKITLKRITKLGWNSWLRVECQFRTFGD